MKRCICLFLLIFIVSAIHNQAQTKYGKVGKYKYEYFRKSGYVMVTFKGKGVEVGGHAKQSHTDAMIIAAIMKTINSVYGKDVITAKQATSYKTEGKWIIIQGTKFTYKATFVIDGDYITDIVFTDSK